MPLLLLAACAEDHQLAERTVTVIGPEGGVARSADGLLAIEFDANVLPEAAEIRVTTRRDITGDDVASLVYALEPDMQFTAPVRLRWAGMPTEEVVAEQIDETGETLTVLPTYAQGDAVVGETSHFSLYVLRRLRRACRGRVCGQPCSLCPINRPGCFSPGLRTCSANGLCLARPAQCIGPDGGIADAGLQDGGGPDDASIRGDVGLNDGAVDGDGGVGDAAYDDDTGVGDAAFYDDDTGVGDAAFYDGDAGVGDADFHDGAIRGDVGGNDGGISTDIGSGIDAGTAGLTFTPAAIEFGVLALRCPGMEFTTATSSVVVRNVGFSDVDIISVASTGSTDFSVEVGASGLLRIGATVGIVLRYRTDTVGQDFGTLEVATNQGSFFAPISGEALAAPQPCP